MECSGQELRTHLGVMRAPGRWEEALTSSRKLSYMAAQNIKPYRERTQDTYGIPWPRTLCRGLPPHHYLALVQELTQGDSSLVLGNFPEPQNRYGCL